jgi:VWFA-related protein
MTGNRLRTAMSMLVFICLLSTAATAVDVAYADTAAAGPAADSSKTEILVLPVVTDFPNVVLNINVRNAKTGEPVEGLTANDFKISEDLAPVSITSFQELGTTKAAVKPVDFTFIFDDTGSMQPEIDGAKRKVLEFANIVKTAGLQYRLALVSFKDAVNRVYDFTSNADLFKEKVSSLFADGGGDEPEDQLDAIMFGLQELTQKDGHQKVFILITDASFHSADRVTLRTTGEVIDALKKAGATLNVVGPNLDQYRWMASSTDGTFFDLKSGQFSKIIGQIAGGSARNYRVAYRSSHADLDDTWRAVEVDLKKSPLGMGVAQYQAPSWVSASSRADGFSGINSKYEPHNLVDGNPDTMWGEGVNGPGVGEWASLRFSHAQPASAFIAVLPSKFEGNAPSRISVTVNDGDKQYFDLKSGEQRQVFSLGGSVNITHFVVEIEKATATNGLPTGIADIELLGGNPKQLIEPIRIAHNNHLNENLASDLNHKGEKLYHRKAYEQAVFYYQQAIEKNPTYAQAYSNLGLAYQRMKNYSKAITANRKAIALARGATRDVVMASSYYNIARIFEAQNKLEQALQNYLWAKSSHKNRVYDRAIARMHDRLGL